MLLIFQEPRHHVLKHPLGPRLDNISMARNQPIKVPPIDTLHRLGKRGAVLSRENIPRESSLPRRRTINRQQRKHQLCPEAERVTTLGPGVLLVGGQVEEQIGLNDRAGRAMQEHQLARSMSINVLGVKLGIEFLGYLLRLILLEDVLEWRIVVLLACLALLI